LVLLLSSFRGFGRTRVQHRRNVIVLTLALPGCVAAQHLRSL